VGYNKVQSGQIQITSAQTHIAFAVQGFSWSYRLCNSLQGTFQTRGLNLTIKETYAHKENICHDELIVSITHFWKKWFGYVFWSWCIWKKRNYCEHFQSVDIDWCSFLRNSLIALLEALFKVDNFFWRFEISVCWHFLVLGLCTLSSANNVSSASRNQAPVPGCRRSYCHVVLITYACLCVCASVCACDNLRLVKWQVLRHVAEYNTNK